MPSFAQSPADAREILERVAATYRGLDSFEWTAISITTTDSGDFRPRPSKMRGQFRRPGQMRLEFPDHPLAVIELTDGQAIWEYAPSRRGFCRPTPNVLKRAPHEAMWALGWSLPYEDITEGLKWARSLGTRELRIGGEAVNCTVVRAAHTSAESGRTGAGHSVPVTYWIDSNTNIVVQQSYRTTLKIPGREKPRTDTSTTTLVSFCLNPRIPKARFTFQPPLGVTKQSCISFSSGG